MTMSLRVGLVGWEMDGTGEVTSWSQAGKSSSIEAEYRLSTFVDAQAVVQQLLGYQLPGASPSVVPIAWDGDASRDGFYRVTAVDAGTDRSFIVSNIVTAKLTVERVTGSASLAGEHTLWGAARSSRPTAWAGAGAPERPFLAWPSTWLGADLSELYAGPGFLQGARAVSSDVSLTATDTLAQYNFNVLTGPTPDTYYDGACTVRVGDPLNVVVGNELATTPTEWEISNGLIKITAPALTASAFDLCYRNKAGTAWSTRTRSVAFWTGGSFMTPIPTGCNPSQVTVLRNTPEAVAVRLLVPVGVDLVHVDLTLRRGSRFVAVTLSASAALVWVLGYYAGCAGATAIDSPAVGVTETADDTDGNRSLILMGDAFGGGGAITTTGRCYNGPAAYRVLNVAMGYVAGGSAAITTDTAPYVERQYFAAVGEVFRVVQQ